MSHKHKRSKFTPGWPDTLAFGRRDGVESELEQFVDDVSTAGVYCLRLLQPYYSNMLTERWKYYNDCEPPDWAWAAFHSDAVYYVGGTDDLRWRLSDHVQSVTNFAQITAPFPPWKVYDAISLPDRETALEVEPKCAENLRQELGDDSFVYQA